VIIDDYFKQLVALVLGPLKSRERREFGNIHKKICWLLAPESCNTMQSHCRMT